MNAFIIEKIALTKEQEDQVRAVLNMPGFTLIREIISARACEQLLTKLDASLYDTETAKLKEQASHESAKRLNHAVEVLDEVAAAGAEWFRIKLDQRR